MDVNTALLKILRDNMVECKDCGLWKECEDKENLCMKLTDKIEAGGLGYQGTVEVDVGRTPTKFELMQIEGIRRAFDEFCDECKILPPQGELTVVSTRLNCPNHYTKLLED